MNFQNIQTDKTNSVILSLEQLSKEYSNTLIKYNQAQLDYVNYLNNSTKTDLQYLRGSAFWGETEVKQGGVNNIDECKAMCLNTPGCTGATYMDRDKFCWADGGKGAITSKDIYGDMYSITQQNTQAINNYMGNLQAKQGYAFWGTSEALQGNVENIEECKRKIAFVKAKGGTFQQTNPSGSGFCWVRNGEGGDVQYGGGDYYSIMPKYPNITNYNDTLNETKGTAFWGSSALNQGPANNINECKAMCLSDKKCTGATYNPDKKYCWTRSGDGPVVPSAPNDYSIVPENIRLLNIIKIYNQQLLNINQKISSIINDNLSLYQNQAVNRNINSNNLNKNFAVLTAERNRIEEQIKKFESLNKEQNEYDLRINYNYYWYFILMAIGFILVFILLKLTEYGKAVIDTTAEVIDTTKNVVVDAGNQIIDTTKAAVDAGKELAVNTGNALANAGTEIKDAAVNAGDAIVNAGKEVVDAGNNLVNQAKDAVSNTQQPQQQAGKRYRMKK